MTTVCTKLEFFSGEIRVFCWGSRECLAVGGVLGADVEVAIGV